MMDLKKKSVLVVEDSTTLANIIKNKIKDSLDVNVVIASSYQMVIDYVEQTQMKFFVALSGLNMPDDPDAAVIDYLCSKNVPVVVVTRTLDAVAREKLFSRDVLDYVLTENIEDLDYAIKLIDKLLKNKDTDILVVDDSKTARFMIKNLLLKRNYNVLEAKDGLEALSVVNESNPSKLKLIITDYNMPNMDGFELVSKVREQYNKTQMGIIAISSISDTDVTVKFLKNGANDFLIKPFHELEFFCRVEQVVDNISNIQEIKELANRDYLTKMYNRRYLFDKLKRLYNFVKKHKEPTAIAILDIDNFKTINDVYGHNTGDMVLTRVATLLRDNFEKPTSIPARLGGEEFCVVLRKSNINKAFLSMEALRRAIEHQKIEVVAGKEINFTVSIGISSNLGNSIDEFIGNADKLLYSAKHNGKNRVEIDKELTIKE